jgi:hypothetical protein
MVKISITFTRPSTSIAWWHETAEANEYASVYNSLGKEQSPDGLSITFTLTYDNEAQYPEFVAANLESISKRMIYNTATGIVENPSTSVTI